MQQVGMHTHVVKPGHPSRAHRLELGLILSFPCLGLPDELRLRSRCEAFLGTSSFRLCGQHTIVMVGMPLTEFALLMLP
jgi:hypothetical protein